MQGQSDFPLPANLPVPVDDGASFHLKGIGMPDVSLLSTAGRMVNFANLSARQTVTVGPAGLLKFSLMFRCLNRPVSVYDHVRNIDN